MGKEQISDISGIIWHVITPVLAAYQNCTATHSHQPQLLGFSRLYIIEVGVEDGGPQSC